jgi:hypothetical protein
MFVAMPELTPSTAFCSIKGTWKRVRGEREEGRWRRGEERRREGSGSIKGQH